MKSYTIFVGSDNNTGKLDLKQIREIVSRRHEAFTLYTATGYWRGSQEKTAVLIVSDDWGKVTRTLSDLKIDLDQEAIGYQESPALLFA